MTSDDAPDRAAPAPAPPRRQRSARHQFAATMLTLEAFVVLFATLVVHGLGIAPPSVVWPVGLSLAAAFLVVAGLLRWPGGYAAGSVLQVLMVAGGVAIEPMRDVMVVLGVVFVALWVASLRLGARIDRERAERAAATTGHPDGGPAGDTPAGGVPGTTGTARADR